MHETLAAFALALVSALAAAGLVPRLGRDLRRPLFWTVLLAAAALAGAASALVAETGHAGTGFVTRHGWPKPFLFEFVAETGERKRGFEALYFAGNALAWSAALLAAWTVARLVSRRRA